MLRCMRTTLSIDDDVAALIEQVIRERRASLKQVVNEALRRGLAEVTRPPKRPARMTTRATRLGRCLIGQLDDVADALATGEGEAFR